MRKANTATTRKAELRRRRLFDFVSPKLVGSAIGLFLAAVLFDYYVHDFIVDWGHDTTQRTVVLVLTNLFLAGMGAWHVYGRKLDAHQATVDRTTQITVLLKTIFFVSMAMSIFFITTAADDIYSLDHLDATLLSLYFQTIAILSLGNVLRHLKLEDIDFDVYKNDSVVA